MRGKVRGPAGGYRTVVVVHNGPPKSRESDGDLFRSKLAERTAKLTEQAGGVREAVIADLQHITKANQ